MRGPSCELQLCVPEITLNSIRFYVAQAFTPGAKIDEPCTFLLALQGLALIVDLATPLKGL